MAGGLRFPLGLLGQLPEAPGRLGAANVLHGHLQQPWIAG
jgi:hypothetical protein